MARQSARLISNPPIVKTRANKKILQSIAGLNISKEKQPFVFVSCWMWQYEVPFSQVLIFLQARVSDLIRRLPGMRTHLVSPSRRERV
jgi:hypothetical protein